MNGPQTQRRVFLSPAEVAPRIDRTTARVYQLINAGELPAVRVAGRIRIPVDAFDAWVAEQTRRALEAVQ